VPAARESPCSTSPPNWKSGTEATMATDLAGNDSSVAARTFAGVHVAICQRFARSHLFTVRDRSSAESAACTALPSRCDPIKWQGLKALPRPVYSFEGPRPVFHRTPRPTPTEISRLLHLRELIRPPFRIVYRRDPKQVSVVRIWRSERLLDVPDKTRAEVRRGSE
jgi:hypothetical protein